MALTNPFPLPGGAPSQEPSNGPLSPDIVGADPARQQMMAMDAIAGYLSLLAQAEMGYQEIGTNFTNDPMVTEMLRAAQEANRQVGYALQASARMGVRDETVPIMG